MARISLKLRVAAASLVLCLTALVAVSACGPVGGERDRTAGNSGIDDVTVFDQPEYGWELRLPPGLRAREEGATQRFSLMRTDEIAGMKLEGRGVSIDIKTRRAVGDGEAGHESDDAILWLLLSGETGTSEVGKRRRLTVSGKEACVVEFDLWPKGRPEMATRYRSLTVADGGRVLDVLFSAPKDVFVEMTPQIDLFQAGLAVTEPSRFRPALRPQYTGPKTESVKDKTK